MKETTEEKELNRPAQEGRTSRQSFTRRLPAFLDPISRIGEHPIRVVEPHIHKGHVVADLGCGWGYYSFVLAGLVGAEGKVFAIDLDETCIKSIQKKTAKKGIHNIDARAVSAARLGFIDDQSVDLVFANGLLCSMSEDRQLAVSEMKRILKPAGKAYIAVGSPSPLSYLDQAEWEEILRGFTIEASAPKNRLWTLVSLKQEPIQARRRIDETAS